ncbi:hypothetical protein [Massilia sp. YMA4]|uniref:hypothetical protein n=1 Tax=Massilia sp. YMA4 TaxID=1593482 RepID=UPI000DD14EC2|nr:hypothetical protein [Massilia sp. YMA4]AXA90347.1 hypothetical protein DPH57_03685 [Massilia sp. YMA4]
MTIVNTHYFNVPVRVFELTTPTYKAYYDYPVVNSTYPKSVIVYELTEAPAGVTFGSVEVTPAGAPFVSSIAAGGRLIILADTDSQSTTEKTYQVAITLTTPTGSVRIDPQIINSPIRR